MPTRLNTLFQDFFGVARATGADVVAHVRSASFVVRSALLSPIALLFVARTRDGNVDDALGLLTAGLVPLFAFTWAWAWGQGARERLRYLRVALPSGPVPPEARVATFALAGVSLLFALVGAFVARRTGAPFTDALAVARVCFASAFACAGLGLTASRRPSFGAFLLPFLFVTMRTHREWSYAFVPNTHAYALTVDPVTGLEARLRFLALLAFGVVALLGFSSSRALRATPVSKPSSAPR